jgi:arylsulfatase A-like enzyme
MVKRSIGLAVAVTVVALVAATFLLARRAERKARPRPAATVVRLGAPDGRPQMLGDGRGTKLECIAADVPSTLSWRVAVPEQARLVTDLAFDRSRVGAHPGLACQARVEAVRGGSPPKVLLERAVEPLGPWQPLAVDLEPRAAPDAELRLTLACHTPDGASALLPRAARWSVPVVYQPRRPPAPNVVLVTVDTLRADHLGAYGYFRPTSPGIDRLARQGVLFRNAESVQSATWPALASLHTAQYPGGHGVIWNGWHLREGTPTLAELLKAKGYDTSAFLTNMTGTRHPGFSRLFLSRGGDQAGMDRRATDAAIEHLGRVGDRRFFLWLHLLSPHADYAPPPPHDVAFTRPGASRLSGTIGELADLRARGVRLSDADVAHLVALYDGEVAYADRQVDRLLSELRERGLEESTLVVFTADHGEDLHEHNRYFFHSPSMYSSSLHVPLILSWPGALPAGARTDHPASLVDVAPTVLSLLGLPAPSSFLGSDLLPGRRVPARAPRAVAFSETSGRIFASRSVDWRFVYNPEKLRPQAPGGPYPIGEVELYDLRRDRRERDNIAERRKDLVENFTTQLLAWKQRERREGGAPEQTIDEETREELKALGYVVN